MINYSIYVLNEILIGWQVVTDIERNDVDFIARTLHLQPIAHIDHFSADKLGSAGLAQEVTIAGSTSKVFKLYLFVRYVLELIIMMIIVSIVYNDT